LLVIGEVVTGEDKPKIFPQEIIALEDAPRKYTLQVHLRLKLEQFTPERIDSVRQLVMTHPGRCPLLLCFIAPGGELVYLETHERYFVTPSRELQELVDQQFGSQTYYAKVDTSLPERQSRRWERASAEN
jgi:hypothetical protein